MCSHISGQLSTYGNPGNFSIMSALMKRNGPLLHALYRATPLKRRDILAHGSPDFFRALSEIALNILNGNIPLSPSQYKKLKKHKKLVRLLTNKKTAIRRKRQTLMKQSGGFLLPLLSAAIPILGNILGGIIRR